AYLWQGSHRTLKSHQGHGIGREGSEETRHKASPVAPPAPLAIHGDGGVLPAREASLAVGDGTAHGIGHEPLLDDVGRVGHDPEALGGQAAGPEVDGGRGHARVRLQPAREDVVRPPPEEEVGAEDDRGAEAAVEAGEAVCGELSYQYLSVRMCL